MGKIFIDITKFAISKKYYINEIFSSFDMHGIMENDSLLKKMNLFSFLIKRKLTQKFQLENFELRKVSFIRKYNEYFNLKNYEFFRLNVSYGKKGIIEVLKECCSLKIRPLIISIEDKISKKWLGKIADDKFIDYIEKENRKGNNISGNDFQTLVIESPLFSRKMKILDSEVFKYKRTIFLKIKRYEFR